MAQGPASPPTLVSGKLRTGQSGRSHSAIWGLRARSASKLAAFPPLLPVCAAPSDGAHPPEPQGPGLALSHPTSPSAEGDHVPFFVRSLSFPPSKQIKIESGGGSVAQWSQAQARPAVSHSSSTAARAGPRVGDSASLSLS